MKIDERELNLRAQYEQECNLISKRCEEIEANTDDYWTIQNAIKENNQALDEAYKRYMKARKQLLKEIEGERV